MKVLTSRWHQRIEELSSEIEELSKRDPACIRLMSVPGIGPIISSAMVAAIGTERGQESAPTACRGALGRKGPNLGTLIIDSPGGNVVAAMNIGRMLRNARMPISIPKGKECVSACIMVLAAAVERNYGGKIGIHRPYFDLSASRPLGPLDVRTRYADLL